MYNTCDEYIRYLCKEKNLSLRQVCKSLGLNYQSMLSNYKRRRLELLPAVQLMEFLDGDVKLLAYLPLAKDYYKSNK